DQKIGWYRGQEKEPIGATQSWVANVYEAHHGWIIFSDSEGVEHRIVPIRKQPTLPPCPACGESADDHNDKACDWKPVVYLPMRSADDPNDVVCYSGTGKGARVAMEKLSGIYGRPGADRKGKSPVLLLESFPLKNEHGTLWPRLTHIVGWEYF